MKALKAKIERMALRLYVRLQCQKGQSTTEYILIIAVMTGFVALVVTVFKPQVESMIKTVGEWIAPTR